MRHPAGHHVAQLNIGQLWHPLEDPRSAGFANNLERVNALAARSDGFVHRVMDEGTADSAGGLRYGPGPLSLSTLSVWKTPQALAHFVLNTLHGKFLTRRAEWFRPQTHRTYVIWPIPAGHIPSPQEGLDHLAHLETNGPSDMAYDFAYLHANAA